MTETKPGQDDLGETPSGAAASHGWQRREKAPPSGAAEVGAEAVADPTAPPGAADPGVIGAEAAEVDAEVGSEALAAELAETKERLLRALAETENLRRRSARELEETHRYALTGFARELLDVADNLTRALESIPTRAREEIDFVRTLAEGVAMTERSLAACFERARIAKVEPGLGDKFDHKRHQAMFEVETSEQTPGTIAKVMQPGYVIADRLLRPAMVGVAKAPPAAATTDGAPDAVATQQGDDQPGRRLDTTA
jgi:molecular chaperone GrpE